MKIQQTDIRVRVSADQKACVSVRVDGQDSGVFEGSLTDAWGMVATMALEVQQGIGRLEASAAAAETAGKIIVPGGKGGGA